MTQLHKKRFAELAAEAESVANSEHLDENGIRSYVDNEIYLGWKVKVRNLLVNACGPTSQHYTYFTDYEKGTRFDTNLDLFKRIRAVFFAAREDYEGGYLSTVRTLVQAEVFATEVEQADKLLNKSFKVAAAVIAGVVLETSLREVCTRNGLSHGKLDKMNADLAKAGVYTLLLQKRITTLAQIRNDAAHGKPEQFDDADVRAMISDVERFLADYLT